MSREPNRDRTIDREAELYYGFASEGVPGLRSRRDEYDPDVDAAATGDGDGRKEVTEDSDVQSNSAH